MFGIGYQEMFVILVVALVIFGPARLPELAGQVGRWVRDFRRMSSDLTGEFEKTFAEVEEVKKSIKREMQSIQDEVEGVGKSTRGDLKKPGSRTAAGSKKPAALKSGTAATGKSVAGKTGSSQDAAANGARTKMPALDARTRGKKSGALVDLPVATKADPLADVSFLEVDVDLLGASNGTGPGANGAAEDGAEAIERVRRRRVSAAYGRRGGA